MGHPVAVAVGACLATTTAVAIGACLAAIIAEAFLVVAAEAS